jgi:hypothetical protein
MVDPGVGPSGGSNAKRDGDDDRKREREKGQLDRGWQSRQQFLRHRLPGGERIPEPAMRQISDIDKKLLEEAAIEPQRMPDLSDRLLSDGRSGKISRRIAR